MSRQTQLGQDCRDAPKSGFPPGSRFLIRASEKAVAMQIMSPLLALVVLLFGCETLSRYLPGKVIGPLDWRLPKAALTHRQLITSIGSWFHRNLPAARHSQGDSKVTRDDLAAARQRNATAAIMNISRVIAPVDIILSLPCGEQKSTIRRVNYWNTIADTLDSLTKARLWNSRNLSVPDKDAH